MKIKLQRGLFFLSGFVGLELLAMLAGATGVMAIQLGDIAPWPDNSSPTGGHVFLLRISDTQGVQRNVRLASYYETQPDGSFIRLTPGAGLGDEHVCSVSEEDLSAGIKRQYLTVTLENAATGNQRSYHIPKSGACTRNDSRENGQGENSENVLYAKYQVPNFAAGDKDGQSNMYRINITISLNDGIPPPDPGQGIGHRIVVGANGGTISQLGGSGRSFPIVGDWNNRDDFRTELKIPFGRPCNDSTEGNERVGIYDADNGDAFGFSPRKVRFQLYEETTSGWTKVGLSDPQAFDTNIAASNITQADSALPGNDQKNVDTFIIPDGAARTVKLASARFFMKKDTAYMMYIYDLAPRNTIDIQLPTPSIFGTLSCNWKINPDTTVDMEYIRVGETANWNHTATNSGSFSSDPVTASVSWSTPAPTTGTLPAMGTQPRVYTKKQSVPYNGGRMTARTADINKTFCQRLRVAPGAKNDSSARTSESCVRVVDPPVFTRSVSLTPVVPNNPNDIEPTEFTTLTGYLNVSNFPPVTSYGYNEYSQRLTAQRVTPNMTDNGIGSGTRTVYTCPSGYSPTNPTTNTSTSCSKSTPTYGCHGGDTTNASNCTHYYSGTANNTKAKCEGNGHNWSGGTCSDTHPKISTGSTTEYTSPSSSTETRYRCEDPTAGAWGAWNGGPPTGCKKYYECPGGARITGTTSSAGWYTSAPTCDGWQCRYPSPQVNQATAPTCEYRCQAGTGNVAFNGSGLYTSPCYQPPSFSVTCKWIDNGFTWSETASGNGPVCDNPPQNQITKQAGTVIGTNVCATLTYNYPYGGWTPSSPSPGYGRDGGGTYRQIETWGWSPSTPGSATGCTRVVGKPTVKVNGGDVVAGAVFTRNGVCNPVVSSNIVGWPHEPVYDASNTQLGLFASSTITGFASAKIGANQSQPPRGLTFSNFPVLSGQNYGGNFGNMKCIPDHYGNPASLGSIPLTSLGNPTYEGSYRGTGGRINTTAIPKGQHVTVYATGNVYITGTGVRYQERGAWTTTEDIPAFKLVVSGGNIYIDPGVQQLDGIYVAQPSSTGVGGNIYTCATSTAPYADSSLYGSCRTNQLVVNGAFIAKKVHLLRTQGTAIFGQTAEQFNYLPELWTAEWPAETNSSASELKYDSILSLPPVL